MFPMRIPIVCLALAGAALIAKEAGVFPALKTEAALGKQAEGLFLVPTNQMLHPWGEQTVIPGRPVDIGNGDARALGHEPPRDGKPDPARATSHDRDFVLELHGSLAGRRALARAPVFVDSRSMSIMVGPNP